MLTVKRCRQNYNRSSANLLVVINFLYNQTVETGAMDVRLLTRFASVIEHGSLNKAADALHLSQPALSKSIQQLEIMFKVPLLHRGARGAVPTEYGKVVFERARLVNVELDNIHAEIAALRDGVLGQVSIGMPPGEGFLTRVMSRVTLELLRGKGRVCPNITVGSRAQLLQALRHGELDVLIAVLGRDPLGDLVEDPLFADRDMLIVRSNHPLRGRSVADVSDLVDYRWVVSTEVAGLADELTAEALKLGLPAPEGTIHSNSSLLIKNLVAQSPIIGFIARDAAAVEIESGQFHELRLSKVGPQAAIAMAPRQIGFIYRNDAALSSASRALMKDIRRVCIQVFGVPTKPSMAMPAGARLRRKRLSRAAPG
jgi:DNA-binding transcriptional LysR family regulator